MTKSSGPDLRNRLEQAFLQAMEHLRVGRDEQARQLLRGIVEKEPRFPEPYLELALLSQRSGDLERAVDEARLGLEMLEEYGQWVDDLPPHVMLAHARVVLGQLLVEAAEAVDLVEQRRRFGALWNEAVELFRQAAEADPDNEQARTCAALYQPMDSSKEDRDDTSN